MRYRHVRLKLNEHGQICREAQIERDSNFIVVIAQTQSIPILIAERLLKFGYQMLQVRSANDVLNLPERRGLLRVAIVEVTLETDVARTLELADALRVVDPDVHVIFATAPDVELASELRGLKNIDVIPYPYEQETILSKVLEIAPVEIPRELLTFDAVTEVQLPALQEFDLLPFDIFIFLPLNQRAILFKKAGQAGFFADLSRIHDVKQVPLYIRQSDFPLYTNYVAKYVSQFDSLESMPEPVRLEVTRKRFSELIRGFIGKCKFDDEEAHQALNSARKVTSEFVRVNTENPVWHERIRSLIGRELTNYNHAINVSAYCVMFGMIIGLDDIDSLSLGGLFHDIGMSALPPEITNKPFEELDAEELEQWARHSEIGVEMIETRGLPLSYEVKEMIRQHHHIDAHDVGAFGKNKAYRYAQVCAFADLFDELTSVRPGHRRFSPKEAMRRIAGMDGANPHPCFDPEFHMKIVEEFLSGGDELIPNAAIASREDI